MAQAVRGQSSAERYWRQVVARWRSSGLSGYNAANDRTSLTDSLTSAGIITYQHDAAHRLTTLSQSFGGTAGPQVVFGYDPGNRLTSESRTIGGSGTAVNTTLAYDHANRVTTIQHYVAGGSTLATYVYGYDNANRVTTEVNAEGTVTYGYDNSNELTSANGSRTESYSYDSGGNRNSSGYTTPANSGNEMTASPGETYTYDGEGNLASKTDTGTGNVWTYNWDYRDRLTGVTEKNSGGTVILQATYTYSSYAATKLDSKTVLPPLPLFDFANRKEQHRELVYRQTSAENQLRARMLRPRHCARPPAHFRNRLLLHLAVLEADFPQSQAA